MQLPIALGIHDSSMLPEGFHNDVLVRRFKRIIYLDFSCSGCLALILVVQVFPLEHLEKPMIIHRDQKPGNMQVVCGDRIESHLQRSDLTQTYGWTMCEGLQIPRDALRWNANANA